MATYKVDFFQGEGRHFPGFVNYLLSQDGGSIYAEIAVPDDASEDYGYLAMKKAILAGVPAGTTIDWWYDAKSEACLEADADVDAEVWTDLQIDEDDEDDMSKYHAVMDWLGEDGLTVYGHPVWFAVIKDREDDDWGIGSRNLKDAVAMARDMEAKYIAVIDDDKDNPVCLDEIELD